MTLCKLIDYLINMHYIRFMKHADRIERIKKERYSQILIAAERIIARRGFGSAKISDIAKEAQVSHGLVYQYFKSKEDIFKAIVKNVFKELELISNNFSSDSNRAIDTIQAIIEFALQDNIRNITNKEYPYKFLIMIQAMSLESAKEILERESTINNPLFIFLRPLIERGQLENDIIAGDPSMLAHSIMSMLMGIALSSIPPFQVNYLPKSDVIMRLIKKDKS